MPKKTIVVFDFDETLVTKDTLIDFIRFNTSLLLFIRGSIRFIPDLIRLKSHTIDNQTAKEHLLGIFFSDMRLEQFNHLAVKYIPRLDRIANEKALEKLVWHQERGHEVIIISASIENWIKPWASLHGINHVIASKLAVKKGHIDGRLAGKNCHGREKVVRLQADYPNREEYTLIAYGDGKSDKELFKAADQHFEKNLTDHLA